MFGAKGGIKAGDSIPEVTLNDQRGQPVSLGSFKGRPLVVYFYPRDETPVCTAESCAFRDQYEDFTTAGAEVVGISSDDEASHRAFAEHHRLPFILLADVDGEARRAFGVPKSLGVLPGRVTYVVDGTGIVRHVFNSQMNAGKHVATALETLRTMG